MKAVSECIYDTVSNGCPFVIKEYLPSLCERDRVSYGRYIDN